MKYTSLFYLFIASRVFTLDAQEVQFTPVQDVNFVADFHASGNNSQYGVLVLGGAEGGKPSHLADKIAALGYSVLSLAYFKEKGLPQELELIPIEYFEGPKQWLLAHPQTRSDGLIVVGWSKGAELALLLSSRDKQFKGVVALAPSSVVWAGILKDWSKVPSSSWSERAKPLSYVPFATGIEFTGLADLYEQSLNNEEAVTKATIKFAAIHSPILLLSGGHDEVWPANKMAQIACDKINKFNAEKRCIHINYPDAGHLLDEEFVLGGTREANAAANKQSTQRIKQFLHNLNAS